METTHMTLRLLRMVLLCVSSILGLGSAAFSQFGILDPTFGVGGIVDEPFPNQYGAISLHGTDQNRSVQVGVAYTHSRYSVVVTWRNEDGTLDNTYGVGGTYIIGDTSSAGTRSYLPEAAESLPNGTMLIAYKDLHTGDHNLMRLNIAGLPDPVFGDSSGVATRIVDDGYDIGDIERQANGKFLIGCYSRYFPLRGTFTTAFRFYSLGHLDLSFGIGGKLELPFFVEYPEFLGMRTRSDSSVILLESGTHGSGAFYSVTVAASFLPAGVVDSGFPTFYHAPPTYEKVCNSFQVRPDGRIVMGMGGYNSSEIMQLDADGGLDPSFGNGGLSPLIAGSLSDMKLHQDGRIVFVGRAAGASEAIVGQILSDGSGLDSTFGSAGTVTVAMTIPIWRRQCAIQEDGKILVSAGIGKVVRLSSGVVVAAGEEVERQISGFVYPNPALDGHTQTLYLRLAKQEDVHVQLFDLHGKLVESGVSYPAIRGENQIPLPKVDHSGALVMRVWTHSGLSWSTILLNN